MQKLFLTAFICVVVSFAFMGCGKHAGSEHPSSGHEHPTSEKSTTEHPK